MKLRELSQDDVISYTFNDNVKAVSVISGIEDYNVLAFSKDLWCSDNDHMSTGRTTLLLEDVKDFVYLGKLTNVHDTHPELFI